MDTLLLQSSSLLPQFFQINALYMYSIISALLYIYSALIIDSLLFDNSALLSQILQINALYMYSLISAL